MKRMERNFKKALELVGGPSALARLLDISPGAITQWNGIVPVKRVPDVEKATGGQVTRHDLRPDFFGKG